MFGKRNKRYEFGGADENPADNHVAAIIPTATYLPREKYIQGIDPDPNPECQWLPTSDGVNPVVYYLLPTTKEQEAYVEWVKDQPRVTYVMQSPRTHNPRQSSERLAKPSRTFKTSEKVDVESAIYCLGVNNPSHPVNQDYVRVKSDRHIFAVFDGAGGIGTKGVTDPIVDRIPRISAEIAADTAIEAYEMLLKDHSGDLTEQDILKYLKGAFEVAQFRNDTTGLGGGAVGTLLHIVDIKGKKYAAIAHAGDTRLFIGRASKFSSAKKRRYDTYSLITEDHADEKGRIFNGFYEGGKGAHDQTILVELGKYDRIMMCSDGITGTSGDNLIEADYDLMLSLFNQPTAQNSMEAFIKASKKVDDKSIIVIDIEPEEATETLESVAESTPTPVSEIDIVPAAPVSEEQSLLGIEAQNDSSKPEVAEHTRENVLEISARLRDISTELDEMLRGGRPFDLEDYKALSRERVELSVLWETLDPITTIAEAQVAIRALQMSRLYTDGQIQSAMTKVRAEDLLNSLVPETIWADELLDSLVDDKPAAKTVWADELLNSLSEDKPQNIRAEELLDSLEDTPIAPAHAAPRVTVFARARREYRENRQHYKHGPIKAAGFVATSYITSAILGNRWGRRKKSQQNRRGLAPSAKFAIGGMLGTATLLTAGYFAAKNGGHIPDIAAAVPPTITPPKPKAPTSPGLFDALRDSILGARPKVQDIQPPANYPHIDGLEIHTGAIKPSSVDFDALRSITGGEGYHSTLQQMGVPRKHWPEMLQEIARSKSPNIRNMTYTMPNGDPGLSHPGTMPVAGVQELFAIANRVMKA